MPQIKICGINDVAVAKRAEELGADYVGFIFSGRSPRRVMPHVAASIASSLEGHARKVGVFTDSPLAEILDVARRVPLDVVQLHSRRYGPDTVRALRLAGLEVWQLDTPGADAILLDGSIGGASGGTGLRADWVLAERLAASGARVVLAGGISADNAQAAAGTGCAVLDVNSSLEVAPGVKSLAKLEAFFRSFRNW